LAIDRANGEGNGCISIFWPYAIYAWEGKIERTDEVLLIIKTQSSRYDALEAFVRAHHPYETPEIVEIPAGRVTPNYLQWIVKETTDRADRQ
jgi:periplasmic divalent cation tolerance protein